MSNSCMALISCFSKKNFQKSNLSVDSPNYEVWLYRCYPLLQIVVRKMHKSAFLNQGSIKINSPDAIDRMLCPRTHTIWSPDSKWTHCTGVSIDNIHEQFPTHWSSSDLLRMPDVLLNFIGMQDPVNKRSRSPKWQSDLPFWSLDFTALSALNLVKINRGRAKRFAWVHWKCEIYSSEPKVGHLNDCYVWWNLQLILWK